MLNSTLLSLFLLVMQEPTGKNFLNFQKQCKVDQIEKLNLESDPKTTSLLTPKKRHNRVQIHSMVLGYRYCTDEKSKAILENTFRTTTLEKNLKTFLLIGCKEKLDKDILKSIVNNDSINKEKLKKHLKAITLPTNCSEFKADFEDLLS